MQVPQEAFDTGDGVHLDCDLRDYVVMQAQLPAAEPMAVAEPCCAVGPRAQDPKHLPRRHVVWHVCSGDAQQRSKGGCIGGWAGATMLRLLQAADDVGMQTLEPILHGRW